MLARKIIESLNVSPIYFIVAFNLSQNLSLIAGICIYDCKPIHLIIQQILLQPHWQNRFTPEDYRALTPLFSGHINPYGLFPLDFSKRLSIGIII